MNNDLQKSIPGIELKKIDVNGKSYFFHPETLTTFTLGPEKAEKLEQLIGDPQAQIPSGLQQFIAEKCARANVADPAISTDVDIALILTEKCNLRCTYCWEYKDNSARSMSSEVALQAVDFLVQLAESRGASNMMVSFFGGEPLLRWNTIRQIIPYAEMQARETVGSVQFRIVTNGTLLNPKIIQYLSRHHCQIIVSFDGTAPIHDAERRSLNGDSSHALAVRALQGLLASMPSQSISVEMTVHHKSLPELEANLEYVRSLGIYNIVLNPIRAFGLPENSPLALTPEDYVLFADFLRRKALEFANLRSNPYAGIVHDHYLDRVVLTERKRVRCEAGRSGFSIGIDGSIYPCVCFAFERICALGHVNTGLDTCLYQNFLQACGTVDDSPECHRCWARYLCGGGCSFQSFSQLQDFRQPWHDDCLYMRTMIASALGTKIGLLTRTLENNQKGHNR